MKYHSVYLYARRYLLASAIVMGAVLLIDAQSTSCLPEPVKVEQQSKKLRSKIDFDFVENETDIDVSIRLPLKIEGEALSNVVIAKEEERSTSFIVPVSFREVDGGYLVWYVVRRDLFKGHIVQISYGGEECEGKYFLQYDVTLALQST